MKKKMTKWSILKKNLNYLPIFLLLYQSIFSPTLFLVQHRGAYAQAPYAPSRTPMVVDSFIDTDTALILDDQDWTKWHQFYGWLPTLGFATTILMALSPPSQCLAQL